MMAVAKSPRHVSDEEEFASVVAAKVAAQLRAELWGMESRLQSRLQQTLVGNIPQRVVTEPGLQGVSLGNWPRAVMPMERTPLLKADLGGGDSEAESATSPDRRRDMWLMKRRATTAELLSASDSDGSSGFCSGPTVFERLQRCWKLEEPRHTGCLAKIVFHDWFSKTSFLVIIMNTAFIWAVTNYTADKRSQELPSFMFNVELAFIVYYTVELLLRLCVHRLFFFWNEEWAWNIFDFVIVLFGVWEVVIPKPGGKASRGISGQDHDVIGISGLDVTFLRVSRILRVTKILRIFKAFRFLQELRVMMSCVLGSMVSLLWACLFLLIMLMISALILVQSMTNYRIDHPECQLGEHEDKVCKDMRDLFGTVRYAMLTLFESTTGGRDWGSVFALTGNINGITPGFFIFYIVFFNFAFYNIVTSMFVDKAMKLAKPDEEYLLAERKKEEKEITKELSELFAEMDEDGSGTVTIQELREASKEPQVLHRFEMLGITLRDVQTFFSTLTAMTEDGLLSEKIFVEGCLKMKGPASSLDVQAIRFQVQDLWKDIHESQSQLRAAGGQAA